MKIKPLINRHTLKLGSFHPPLTRIRMAKTTEIVSFILIILIIIQRTQRNQYYGDFEAKKILSFALLNDTFNVKTNKIGSQHGILKSILCLVAYFNEALFQRLGSERNKRLFSIQSSYHRPFPLIFVHIPGQVSILRFHGLYFDCNIPSEFGGRDDASLLKVGLDFDVDCFFFSLYSIFMLTIFCTRIKGRDKQNIQQ